jgi:hypothetical protein
MIVVWKNTGHPDLIGKEVEFFKVSWTGTEWLRDVGGKWWGIEHPTKPRNIRLMGAVEDYGEVKEEKSSNISAPSVKTGTPDLTILEALEKASNNLGEGELDYE